jgi:uncharacterized protein YebE (UPF0316 family)
MNIFLLIIIFLTVGFLEMLFWSLQTKALVKDRMFNTFIFTFISIVIWFYVVSKVAENVNNIWLMISYGVGCSFGNCLTIKIDAYIDKIAKARLWKKKKKIRRYARKK